MACTELEVLIHNTTLQWAKENKIENLTEATAKWVEELGQKDIGGREMRIVVAQAIVDVKQQKNANRRKALLTEMGNITKEAQIEQGLRARIQDVVDQLNGLPPGKPVPKSVTKTVNEVITKLREELNTKKGALRLKKAEEKKQADLREKILETKAALAPYRRGSHEGKPYPKGREKKNADGTEKTISQAVQELKDDLKKHKQELALRDKLLRLTGFTRETKDTSGVTKAVTDTALSDPARALMKQIEEEQKRIKNLRGNASLIRKKNKTIAELKNQISLIQQGKYSSALLTNKNIKTESGGNSEVKNLNKKIATLRKEAQLLEDIVRLQEGKPVKRRLTKKGTDTAWLQTLKKYKATLSAKQMLAIEIAKLEEQLATGEFELPETKQEKEYDDEQILAMMERDKLRREVRLEIENKAKPTGLKKALNLFSHYSGAGKFLKTFAASVDASMVGVQGGTALIMNPKAGLKALPKAASVLLPRHLIDFPYLRKITRTELFGYGTEGGEVKMDRRQREYDSDPNIQRWKRAGLAVWDLNGEAEHGPELYSSRLAKRVPLIASSNRIFTHYLNELRLELMDQMVTVASYDGPVTHEHLKQIARTVNIHTGEGAVDRTDKAGAFDKGLGMVVDNPIVQATVWAPRFNLSQFQVLAEPFKGLTGSESVAGKKGDAVAENIRNQIAMNNVKLLGGMAVGMSLMQVLTLLVGDDEEFAAEINPTSSSFGSVRAWGREYKLFGNILQPFILQVRLLSALASGVSGHRVGGYKPVSRKKEDVEPLTAANIDWKRLWEEMTPTSEGGRLNSWSGFGKDPASILGNYGKNKLGPLPTLFYEVAMNERRFASINENGGRLYDLKNWWGKDVVEGDSLLSDPSYLMEKTTPIAMSQRLAKDLPFERSVIREMVDTFIMFLGFQVRNYYTEEQKRVRGIKPWFSEDE